MTDGRLEPFYNEYTAYGSALKRVRCNDCGTSYWCAVAEKCTEGVVGSHPDSELRARANAASRLRQALRSTAGTVPCPVCYAYPPPLVTAAKRAWRDRLLSFAGATSALLGAVLLHLASKLNEGGVKEIQAILTFEFLCWTTAIVGSILAVGWLLIKPILSHRFNPNRKPIQRRMEIARRASCSEQEANEARLKELRDQARETIIRARIREAGWFIAVGWGFALPAYLFFLVVTVKTGVHRFQQGDVVAPMIFVPLMLTFISLTFTWPIARAWHEWKGRRVLKQGGPPDGVLGLFYCPQPAVGLKVWTRLILET